MTKICTKCKVEKSVNEFRLRSKTSNTLRSHCNLCLSQASVSYNLINKDKTLLNNNLHKTRLTFNANLRYSSFKSRLKEKVQLSKEEYCNIFANDPKCTYCDELIRSTGSGLDRIDNSKGYQINNVLPCCGTCNDIRGNNLTVEEMKIAMAAIIKFRRAIL